MLRLVPQINREEIRSQDPDPPFHPFLRFQGEKRAETGESMPGSYEGSVVSKHGESCSSFVALSQPHQKSHWVSLLPWASAAFGAAPAGTNIVGSETLGFTVLQDIRVSGLSSKDMQRPGSRHQWTRPPARGFGELQRLQKRAMEMESTLLSSCDGKEVYLPIPTAPGRQTPCIGLPQQGTKVQSSAVSPF